MKRTLLIFSALVFAGYTSHAQFKMQNLDEWNKVKNDTTYILMDSLSSHRNDSYKKLFTQYWKATPIRFIDAADYTKYLSPHASYFSYVYKKIPVQVHVTLGRGAMMNAAMARGGMMNMPPQPSPANNNMDMQLWVCSEKYFKKKKKWNVSYSEPVITMEIYLNMEKAMNTDPSTYSQSSLQEGKSVVKEQGGTMNGLYGTDNIDWVFNWGEGVLKNYIQILNAMVAAGKKGEPPVSKSNVRNLKNATLYVPDYIKWKLSNTGSLKASDMKSLMSGYKLKYSVKSMQDINDIIMHSAKDMYYLMYVNKFPESYVYVINGYTGEIVYAAKAGKSMEKGDIKDVYKAAMK